MFNRSSLQIKMANLIYWKDFARPWRFVTQPQQLCIKSLGALTLENTQYKKRKLYCSLYLFTLHLGKKTHFLPASILYKTRICKCIITNLTTKTVWVPVCLHGLYNSANHKFAYNKTATLSAPPHTHTNVCSKLKIKLCSNDVFLRLNAFWSESLGLPSC